MLLSLNGNLENSLRYKDSADNISSLVQSYICTIYNGRCGVLFICTKVFQNLHSDRQPAPHFLFLTDCLRSRAYIIIITMKIVSGVLFAAICFAMISCGIIRTTFQDADTVESATVSAEDTVSVSAPAHEAIVPVKEMEQPESAGPSTNVVKPRPPMFGK